MTAAYNPTYQPSGLNNKANPYRMKINHRRLAKFERSKTQLGLGGGDDLGPNLLINGDFATGDWVPWLPSTGTAPQGIQISNGSLLFYGATGAYMYQALTLETDKTYRWGFERMPGTGAFSVVVRQGSTGNGTYIVGTTRDPDLGPIVGEDFTPPVAGVSVAISVPTGLLDDTIVDNLFVRELGVQAASTTGIIIETPTSTEDSQFVDPDGPGIGQMKIKDEIPSYFGTAGENELVLSMENVGNVVWVRFGDIKDLVRMEWVPAKNYYFAKIPDIQAKMAVLRGSKVEIKYLVA